MGTNFVLPVSLILNGYYFLPYHLTEIKQRREWWLSKQDTALLRGVNKHGFGEFKKIREDPELGLAEAIDKVEAETGSDDATGTSRK